MVDPMFLVLLFAPLLGFLINGVNFRSQNCKAAGFVASSMILLSFVSSLFFFFQLLGLEDHHRTLQFHLFKWIEVGGFTANFAFTIDPLSSVMILIITGIGFLIHLFSIGYMDHDERPAKYFAYLNFFVFNMLLLVLGDNLLVMFVGWEGVGLCSYLLIGFWFEDVAKAAAGMKAFITNRIGDAGFLLGIFTIFQLFDTVKFAELGPRIADSIKNLEAQLTDGGGHQLVQSLTEVNVDFYPMVTLACIFLFIGACGKSAQIPLYVWLPDAMAGPTPVSALIHAATMVTAGVYMIIRTNVLFVQSPTAMMVVASIGALTALFAATMGLVQNDIKKVLAYSTVSQLGFMFLAVGVGAWGAGFAHLMTHAFFKALMFLGSGSIIHAMHHEQDMGKMGGLWKAMPITHFTFCCGWLAIIGFPLLSGFMSKDEILWMAYHSPRGSFVLYLMGLVAAIMTTFYMTRLMALTFWTKPRWAHGHPPHESNIFMTIPLLVLAVLSVFGGLLVVPHGLGHNILGGMHNYLDDWIHPLLSPIPGLDHGDHWSMEATLMVVAIVLTAASAYGAYYVYILHDDLSAKLKSALAPVHRIVFHKYFVDEGYFAFIINPLVTFSRNLWSIFDVKIVDGATYFIASVVKNAGGGLRTLQSGNLQMYAFYILAGIVVSLIFLMTR